MAVVSFSLSEEELPLLRVSGRQGTGRLVGFAPWYEDCHQLGWKERSYAAEAPFFAFDVTAQAGDVGEGDILGEEPRKTWGEEAGSSHFDCMTLKYSSIRISNVFTFQK